VDVIISEKSRKTQLIAKLMNVVQVA